MSYQFLNGMRDIPVFHCFDDLTDNTIVSKEARQSVYSLLRSTPRVCHPVNCPLLTNRAYRFIRLNNADARRTHGTNIGSQFAASVTPFGKKNVENTHEYNDTLNTYRREET